MPDQFHKYIDCDQTKTEQGNRPTKTFVNMWFKNDTNMATLIVMFGIVENELKKIPYTLRGQEVSARLELSPTRKPLAKAHALFYKGLKESRGG